MPNLTPPPPDSSKNPAILKFDKLNEGSTSRSHLGVQFSYLKHARNTSEVIEYLIYIFEKTLDNLENIQSSRFHQEIIKEVRDIPELRIKDKKYRFRISQLEHMVKKRKHLTAAQVEIFDKESLKFEAKLSKVTKELSLLTKKHKKLFNFLHHFSNSFSKLNQHYLIYAKLIHLLENSSQDNTTGNLENPHRQTRYRILSQYIDNISISTLDFTTGSWLTQWCRLLDKIANPQALIYTAEVLDAYDGMFEENQISLNTDSQVARLRKIYIDKIENYEDLMKIIIINKSFIKLSHLRHIPIPKLKSVMSVLLQYTSNISRYSQTNLCNQNSHESYDVLKFNESMFYVVNIYHILNALADLLPNEYLHYIVGISINQDASYTGFLTTNNIDKAYQVEDPLEVWKNIRRLLIAYAEQHHLHLEQDDSLYQKYQKKKPKRFANAIQALYKTKNNRLLEKSQIQQIPHINKGLNELIRNITKFGISKSDFRLCFIVWLEHHIQKAIDSHPKIERQRIHYNTRIVFYKELQHLLYTSRLSSHQLLFKCKDFMSEGKANVRSVFDFLSSLRDLLRDSVRDNIPYEQIEMPDFQDVNTKDREILYATDPLFDNRKLHFSYASLLAVPIAGSLDFAIQKFTEYKSRNLHKFSIYKSILPMLRTLKAGGCTDEIFHRLLIAASGNDFSQHCASFFSIKGKNHPSTSVELFHMEKLHDFLASSQLGEFLESNYSELISLAKVVEILPKQSQKIIATAEQQASLHNKILIPLAKKLNECLRQQQKTEFDLWSKKFQKIHVYYQNNYLSQTNDCFTSMGKLPVILQIVLEEFNEMKLEQMQMPSSPEKGKKRPLEKGTAPEYSSSKKIKSSIIPTVTTSLSKQSTTSSTNARIFPNNDPKIMETFHSLGGSSIRITKKHP